MAGLRFTAEPEPQGIRLRLLERRGLLRRGEAALPCALWWDKAPPSLALPLAALRAWMDDEVVEQQGDDAFLLPHSLAAGLNAVEARRLGLPPAPGFALHVRHEGTIDRPDFRLTHGWRSIGGRSLVGIERIGAWLRTPDGDHLLPAPLFELSEAVDAFALTESGDDAARWRAWQRVQSALPQAEGSEVDPYLHSFTIAYAARFSLHPFTGADGFDFDPVLFAPAAPARDALDPMADAGDPEALLPEELHEVFARQRFRSRDRPQARHTLAPGHYLVLDPGLEAALGVVREAQRGDRGTRRAFARNPHQALRTALEGRLSEDALETLFVETAQYSARVKDLGIWAPPVLPWVKLKGNDWFPGDPASWPEAGLRVGDRTVVIPPDAMSPLIQAIELARAEGRATVPFSTPEGSLEIPATSATLEGLRQLPGGRPEAGEKALAPDKAPGAQQVLQIEDNLQTVGYAGHYAERDDKGAAAIPSFVKTALKDHQKAGVAWLETLWREGAPGALLADDMGLGKTLQCLAFLDFVRRVGERGATHRPVLVVAPTSLLENWLAEHMLHFEAPGLGMPIKLWGPELRRARRADSSLDGDRLGRAGWILTTYETLRDHHQVIAAMRFAVTVFDEAQKIKNPGSLVSHAARTVNADFIIALTGTPIENRLADLWSIADLAHPGLLGELESFSKVYEAPDTPIARLTELKASIAEPRRGREPFMLRRMKDDHLQGLPEKSVVLRPEPMPAEQQAAYAEAVALARGDERGKTLQALQRIKSVSLHPLDPATMDAPPEAYARQSARWRALLAILDEIAERREKALVFCEIIAAQRVLSALTRLRYGLPEAPLVINGSIAGPRRMQMVQRFQEARPGFELMILGPKAAGVGLTLTAANHVVHLTRWWNPAVEDQCTDRVYRMGQSRPVTVWIPQAIFPESEASSFDLRLHALLERKRELSCKLLAAPAGTQSEAEELLRSTIG